MTPSPFYIVPPPNNYIRRMHITQSNSSYSQFTANGASLSDLEAALIEKQDDLYLIEEDLYELAEKWMIENGIDTDERLSVEEENQLKNVLYFTILEKRNVQIDIELLINKIQTANDENSEENTKTHIGMIPQFV